MLISNWVGIAARVCAFGLLVGSGVGCVLQPGSEQDTIAETSEALGSYSSQYFWRQGMAPVDMGDINQEVCFLTVISGKFRGLGESVQVIPDTSTNRWVLTGSSAQVGVLAAARCVPWAFSAWTWEIPWQSGQGDVVLGNHKACMLTRVSGDFEGGGEVIRTYAVGSTWHVTGQAGSSQGVRGGVICMDQDGSRPALSVTPTTATYDQAATGEHAVVFGFAFGENEPLSGPVCFLSRMTGKFSGGGESIGTVATRSAIFQRWDFIISASASQPGVATSVVCIN